MLHVEERPMHPWAMQRWAEDRQCELVAAAVHARAARQARLSRAGSTAPTHRAAARFLGEFLIRTGWRLVGPESPPPGVRPRLALRAPGAMVDAG
jgi:hypothetical protein